MMKKTRFVTRLILLAVTMAMPLWASAQVSDNTFMFLRGDGTDEHPFIIDSYESLVEFRELVALTPLDVRYRNVLIKADIDLGADPNWAPIRYYDSVADKSPMLCQILSNSHKHKSDRKTVIGPFKYRHVSIKEFREVRNVLTQVIIIGGQATECIQHNTYNDHRAELKPAGQIPHQHDTQQAGHEKP